AHNTCRSRLIKYVARPLTPRKNNALGAPRRLPTALRTTAVAVRAAASESKRSKSPSGDGSSAKNRLAACRSASARSASTPTYAGSWASSRSSSEIKLATTRATAPRQRDKKAASTRSTAAPRRMPVAARSRPTYGSMTAASKKANKKGATYDHASTSTAAAAAMAASVCSSTRCLRRIGSAPRCGGARAGTLRSQRQVVNGRRHQHQAVETVQHAAMPRQQPPAVSHAGFALERRLQQVAQLRRHRNRRAQHQRAAQRHRRREDRRQQHADEAGHPAADGARDRLVRAQ